MSSLYTEITAGYAFEKAHVIPDKVLKDPDLSSSAKLLFALITSHVSADSYPTNQYFADNLSCSVRQIVRLLGELRQQGYLGTPNVTSWNRMLFINKQERYIGNNNGNKDNNNNLRPGTGQKLNKLVPRVGPIRFTGQAKPRVTPMSLSGRPKSQQDPTIKLPRRAKKILELWIDRRLRKTDFHLPTKVTLETLEKINLLLSGKLYGNHHSPGVLGGENYIGYNFTIAEITKAIDRFEQATNDKYYHTFKKETLKSVSLGDFFYNPYGNNKTKCYFLWFLENEPAPLFNPDIKDQRMYDFLVKAYLAFKRLPETFEFKTADKSHLIDLSNKLSRHIRVHKKSLPHKVVKFEYQAAMCFLHSALEYHKGNMGKITPYSIKGDWIFEAFPDFISRHRFTDEWKVPNT